MDKITRRQVAGTVAFAGAVALTGLNPAKAADEKSAPFDAKAERQRVIACGLTDAEADCWVAIADAVGKFFDLPKLHPMDDHEVAHAIHTVQHKLLSRPAYRKYKDLAKGESK